MRAPERGTLRHRAATTIQGLAHGGQRQGGPPVGENTQVRQLYRDALSGKLNRREVFQRGIALGLSANVIGMLALNAVKVPSAFAAEEGKPSATFYDWMLNLHPRITSLG